MLGTALDRDPDTAALLGLRTPDHDDLVAGLALVDQARHQTNTYIDSTELELLTALRAAGLGWADIGRHLGYPPESAAGKAQRRFTRLRKRWPNIARTIDSRYAAGPHLGQPAQL